MNTTLRERIVISQHVVGVYVNPVSTSGAYRYAHLLWETVYSDGTIERTSGASLYEHQDGGPEWPLLLKMLSALWGTLIQVLTKHEKRQP